MAYFTPLDIRAAVSAVGFTGVGSVSTDILAYIDAKIRKLDFSAFASVFPNGDKTDYVRLDDAELLGGLRAFAAGPGIYIVGGSNYLLQLDTVEPRTLQIHAATERLPGTVVALASNPEHIFAVLAESRTNRHWFIAHTNDLALTEVFKTELNIGDSACWVAYDELSEVVAHPDGKGRAVFRNASTLAVVGEVSCAPKGANARFVRHRLLEAPEDLPNSPTDKRSFLYVFGQEGRISSAQYRRYIDDEGHELEAARSWGTMSLRDGHTPGVVEGPQAACVRGATVTPRLPVIPTFDGVVVLGGGAYLTLWGYDNPNETIIDQPVQDDQNPLAHTRNFWPVADVAPPVEDGASLSDLLPTLLFPGSHRAAFAVETRGEDMQWQLETQAGGSAVSVDYDVLADPSLLAEVGAFTRREVPAQLHFQLSDGSSIEQTQHARLEAKRFNDASTTLNLESSIRHTEEENDDIEVAQWVPRDGVCRIAGGYLQRHADQGTMSRQYVPELDRERATGQLFSLSTEQVQQSQKFSVPTAIAQDDEAGTTGRIVADYDTQVVVMAATSWDSLTDTSVGRFHTFKRTGSNPVRFEYVDTYNHPGVDGWADSMGLQFSRAIVMSPDGKLLFVSCRDAPGVALYDMSVDGVATYRKTITYPEFTANPLGGRAHELNYVGDGILVIGTPNRTFGDAGEVHILLSSDNWDTFALQHLLTAPFGHSIDDDAFGFVVRGEATGRYLTISANWIDDRDGRAFVYRSLDGWQTIDKIWELPRPAFLDGMQAYYGLNVETSYDGFMISVSAPGADVGALTAAGLVYVWERDILTDTYVLKETIESPNPIVNGGFGRGIRHNEPTSRLLLIEAGVPGYTPFPTSSIAFLWGRHGDRFSQIGLFSSGDIQPVHLIARTGTQDAYLFVDENGNNGAGSFYFLDFPEAP